MNNPEYEKRDTNGGIVLLISVVSVILLTVILVFLNEAFIFQKEKLYKKVALSPESIILREVNVKQAEQLNSFSIVDSAKGLARIPIDAAIKIMADKSFADRE